MATEELQLLRLVKRFQKSKTRSGAWKFLSLRNRSRRVRRQRARA